MDISSRLMAFFLFAAMMLLSNSAQALQFWVATTGNDANPGTKDLPFATLARAKLAVRTALDDGKRGFIAVNVHGGTYRLDASLKFEPADSAKSARIIYRAVEGEIPVVTGAIPVAGWAKDVDRIYKADLGAVALKPSRQLYVNNNRALRSRTPDYPASFKPQFVKVAGEWQAPGIQYIYNPILNPTFKNPFDWAKKKKIEALIVTQWKMSICVIDDITSEVVNPDLSITPGLITLQNEGWNNANNFRDKDTGEPSIWSFWQVTRFENCYDFLDSVEEWYLDEDAKMLYYIPRWGEDISTATVELPQLETLIEIVGDKDNPVRNITFKGFTFRGATWNGPGGAGGYVADQSGFFLKGNQDPNYIGHADPDQIERTPGNISLKYTSKIEFRKNIFEQLGAVAIDLAGGCVQTRIDSNIFRDISSAAVQIGGVSRNDARPAEASWICSRNTVSNNQIYHTGQDYFDSAAIFVGFTQKTLITHNTIVDVPWSGVAIGWGWGLMDEGSYTGVPGSISGQWGTFNTPTIMEKNRITYNDISGFINMLWDGGSIYSTGQQGPTMSEGTLIAGNVAHVKRLLGGGNTFYTDGGSRYMKLRANVSYDNPVGITYFGPAPNPLDPLPYPDVAILNGIPYGSDTGGCRTYGDISYTGNYLLSQTFFSVDPYVDPNGVIYPINMEYRGNHTITGVQDVPKGCLRKAGNNLFK